ncbi:MAG TPA: cupredoxin domain-containing protein [Rhizomicrobium sp.]|jgi:hypothetical protein|nr:cupredoxin domain-containing protein [Rhizomicrobium sp.]
MSKYSALAAAFAIAALGLAPISAAAEDLPQFTLKIQNHRFVPETLTLPAGKRVVLLVTNADPTPEEFESYDLDREKIIVGNTTGKVYIGPLDPGTYAFFGDFHQDTAKGRVIVK